MKQEKGVRRAATTARPSSSMVDLSAPRCPADVLGVGGTSAGGPPAIEVELHEAASEGGVQWMTRLLDEEGFEPGSVDSKGATALHLAAANGRNEACALLLERRADVNATDAAGCTPLAWLRLAAVGRHGPGPGPDRAGPGADESEADRLDGEHAHWPEAWRATEALLLDAGAHAVFLPAYSFSM